MSSIISIRQNGKKGREWQRAKKKLLKEALAEGKINYNSEGICERCKKWKTLTPDHIIKRSRGGKHCKENIQWLCIKCHNEVDNMPGSKKSTKADWEKPHKCKHCKKKIGGFIICPFCGNLSVEK